jgi:catechol 2,3-dioxygenase-like lactoylglutathione lyase family enzyme
MIVDRLAHYSIRTTDLEASRWFYTEVLGLRVGSRPAFDFPGYWLYSGEDEGDLGVVHLIGAELGRDGGATAYLGHRDAGALHGGGAVDHVAFAATGWPAARARFEAMGVPYFEQVDPEGRRQVFVRDPTGVIVELNYASRG